MGTTNILDLNNRLSKVEKENVAQNSYTSLKNKPKINNVTLTGNKSSTDLGLAAASDITGLQTEIGNLTALTTTDKSSCVGAINEVNWKAGTFGTYTISNATDIRDFIKKLITQADADLASKPAYMLFNIFAVYSNVDVFYGTIERQENHAYAFSLSRSNGDYIYQGYCNLTVDSLELYQFITSNKAYSLVSLNPTYDAGTDWNIVKQGNICVLNMVNLKDIPAGWTTIGNIPAGFKPESSFYETAYSANKNTHFEFGISSDGSITIHNQTGATLSGDVNVYRNVCYFT